MANENDPKIKLGEVLPRLLEERGLSISRLAKETGVPKSSIFDWTVGRIPRNLAELRKIAQYLEVSFHFLVFGEEDPHR